MKQIVKCSYRFTAVIKAKRQGNNLIFNIIICLAEFCNRSLISEHIMRPVYYKLSVTKQKMRFLHFHLNFTACFGMKLHPNIICQWFKAVVLESPCLLTLYPVTYSLNNLQSNNK